MIACCARDEPGAEPSALPGEVVEMPEVGPPAVERDEQGFEVDPPGEWLAGDLHVHATGASNDTGGDSWPASIAARNNKRTGFRTP